MSKNTQRLAAATTSWAIAIAEIAVSTEPVIWSFAGIFTLACILGCYFDALDSAE